MLMMTDAIAEPLTPAARAILDALEAAGPMTRAQLAETTGQPLGVVGTRLYLLAKDGSVVLAGDDMVALPGQPLDPWLPDEERVHEQRRRQWQETGLITLHPDDLDGFAAQALHPLAVRLYGRRRSLRR